jgi:uncharacterized protein YdeI (YjbR/CyaY-like superfamily)
MKYKDLDMLAFKSRALFRDWLHENFDKSPGIWLRIFKVKSLKQTVTYQEAIEESLCYGWIDSVVNSYDETSYVQRFTPRRKKSVWSKRNTLIVHRLIETGLMQPSGLVHVEAAKLDGRWENAYTTAPASAIKDLEVPKDFLTAVKENQIAYERFSALPKAKRSIIAAKLSSAKKEETRARRMKAMIEALEKGKAIR